MTDQRKEAARDMQFYMESYRHAPRREMGFSKLGRTAWNKWDDRPLTVQEMQMVRNYAMTRTARIMADMAPVVWPMEGQT